jgi:adenosylhomocysteine nucleosidase
MESKNVVAVIAIVVAVIALIGCLILIDDKENDEDDDLFQKVGIIGAMADEVQLLKDEMEVNRITTVSEMEFYEGTLRGHDVVLVQCGMGKVNAGICAQLITTQFKATCVINTGVAGALDDSLEIGDFVVSVDAIQHDFDVSPIGFKKGEIPYTGKISFEADLIMIRLAERAFEAFASDTHYVEGRVCSGDQFISSTEQKERIIDEFDGTCCEMEGGAIAHVCYLNNTPFVIIRAMSDKADGSAPEDYKEFEKQIAILSSKIVLYMIEAI